VAEKRGGRTFVLQVPQDSTFALSTRRKEEKEQEERSELKRLVLVRHFPLPPFSLSSQPALPSGDGAVFLPESA
jgi:hypothetical protein